MQGLQYTQTAIAFGLLFDEINKHPQSIALASKSSNLNLLAYNGAVISSQASKWPEKDAESLSSGNGKWVKWKPIDPANENGKHRATFSLGDFAVFGQFLHALVGNVRQTPEVPNA